ncbi:O-antigen ligase family protein [Methylobacter sp. G7]|uniref:O-antigen ligase family protein n=1 Tax=Methylobacter sp. G7 TaxID=3230117 RepID=UPI003D804FEE
MTEILLTAVLFLAAFFAAIGAIFCFMRLMHMLRNKEEGYLPYIFYTSTFVFMLTHIVLGRNMFVYPEPSNSNLTSPSYFLWISRANTTFILFAACQWLTSRLMHYGSKPNAPTLLIIAFLFLFFTNVFIPAFFSTHPSLSHQYVYMALLGVASLLFAQEKEETAIHAFRNSIFIFLVVSAGFITWNPGLVFSKNYLAGVIPGLTYRYAGLADHPNTLGSMATLFLLCLWSKPFPSRWINFLGWTIGYLSLVLAQSKTCWIVFILCMSCLGYFKYGDFLKQRLLDFKNPILPAIFIIMSMITASIVLGVVMFSDIGSKFNSFFSTREGSDLMTMTGRTMIWEVALNEWNHNPLFGYGLTIWDDAHRARIGMPWAVTAHSQFYQSLASAGTVGVSGLLIYVTTLFWFALKTAKSSRGLTIAIFLMLSVRGISEVPLTIIGFDFDALTHALLLMIIGAQFKSDRTPKKTNNSPNTYFLQE